MADEAFIIPEASPGAETGLEVGPVRVVVAGGAAAELVADSLWAMGASAVVEMPLRGHLDGRVALLADVDLDVARRAGLDAEAVSAPAPEGDRVGGSLVSVGEGPGGAPMQLRIEDGGLFGSGSHPTTRLALGLLRRWVRPGWVVLDVGSGSGVLAVAAAVLGAELAVGVDPAPGAAEVLGRNALINGVGERVVFGAPLLEQLEWTQLRREPVADLVVANLVLAEQRGVAPAVSSIAALDAVLVFTGILDVQVPALLELYPGWREVDRGEAPVESWEGSEWLGVVLVRRP